MNFGPLTDEFICRISPSLLPSPALPFRVASRWALPSISSFFLCVCTVHDASGTADSTTVYYSIGQNLMILLYLHLHDGRIEFKWLVDSVWLRCGYRRVIFVGYTIGSVGPTVTHGNNWSILAITLPMTQWRNRARYSLCISSNA